MILIIVTVVFICIGPLSVIVLIRNQKVVLDKTYEVCKNLGENISNIAMEELLMNETYDSTRTSLIRLKSSNISGLLDAYVINIDGKYVAQIHEKKINQSVPENDLKYFFSLGSLGYQEIQKHNSNITILQFAYPIFIDYRDKRIRVGATVFEFNKDDVYQPVYEIRATIFLVSGILVFIGILIALYTGFILSKPIQILTDGAKLIASGDLTHRIRIQNQDEIGDLALTFNLMSSQIQDFTHNLESKVVERTEELNKSLRIVQELKEKQDGDYYLTSLLLQPLQSNNNHSKSVKSEFLIKQKKRFTFKNRESEIGGDICITDTIILNNQEYTIFLNGDAMGKSIQGAGGALVLGVVFNAGIMRSRLQKNQVIYPETWLKERFLDLQNVFTSFEGSMYISIFLGLLDTKTGILYYINAEHPWTVLYRDNKASFLEEELTLRKLGMPENEKHFFVRLFQMYPNDSIIVGSDGRDDISEIDDEKDKSKINADEYQFLYRIEEANGDLLGIVDHILETGYLIDDLSLMKITFTPQDEEEFNNNLNNNNHYNDLQHQLPSNDADLSKSIEEFEKIFIENSNFVNLLNILGNLYFQNNDFGKAIDCFEQYLASCPSDNEAIYKLSGSLFHLKLFNEAADVGERLYLRDPNHIENLIQLTETYLELHVISRAEYLFNKIQENQSDHKKIDFLYQSLEDKKKSIAVSINSENNNKKFHQTFDSILKKANEFYAKKDYQNACNEFKKAFEIQPKNSLLAFKIANSLSFLNHLKEAIEYYHVSLQHSKDNYHSHNNLGSVYYRIGNREQAKLHWETALNIKPGFSIALKNLERMKKNTQEVVEQNEFV